MRYYVNAEKVIYEFDRNHPAVLIVDGEASITIKTRDCYSNLLTPEKFRSADFKQAYLNPATGPIALKGAKAGDTLKIEIEDITVESPVMMRLRPQQGLYGQHIKQESLQVITIENNHLLLADKKLALEPMIGVIGTTPLQTSSTQIPGFHGGNLDCSKIKKGSTVYLPVLVDQALLALGDLHALMGDGEAAVCGGECRGEVNLKLALTKRDFSYLPLVEDKEYYYLLASAPSLDEAVVKVTENSVKLLHNDYGYSEETAILLLSLVGDIAVCQAVNAQKTVRLALAKKHLE